MHACFESHTPLVNGCIDDVLFNAALNVQLMLSRVVYISNFCLVDALPTAYDRLLVTCSTLRDHKPDEARRWRARRRN